MNGHNLRRTSVRKKSILKRKSIKPNNPLENYVFGRTIGRGAFGKVKIALHVQTGEKVAVKILEKSKILDPIDIERVIREISILKGNRHPNIIQLYEVIDSISAIYLVMEYVDGGELFHFIVKSKRLAEEVAVLLYHQILDAIEYMHRSGVTHRDLKPENMLLAKNEQSGGWDIKIVDFGLSNFHQGGKLLSTACGSPCYAAPEMIEGKKYEGPAADIWSIGVVLFAMVCGYLPFEDYNTTCLYRKILMCEYNTPDDISESVQDLIMRILETDPKKRYTIDDMRSHPWVCQMHRSPQKQNYSSRYIELNKTVLDSVEKEYGLVSSVIIDSISKGVPNSFTTTYYLQLRKFNSSTDFHEKEYETLRIKANNGTISNAPLKKMSTSKKADGSSNISVAKPLENASRRKSEYSSTRIKLSSLSSPIQNAVFQDILNTNSKCNSGLENGTLGDNRATKINHKKNPNPPSSTKGNARRKSTHAHRLIHSPKSHKEKKVALPSLTFEIPKSDEVRNSQAAKSMEKKNEGTIITIDQTSIASSKSNDVSTKPRGFFGNLKMSSAKIKMQISSKRPNTTKVKFGRNKTISSQIGTIDEFTESNMEAQTDQIKLPKSPLEKENKRCESMNPRHKKDYHEIQNS